MTENIPKILYHYTDINALISIVQNKKIWLSSAENLNDKKEITWAWDKFDGLYKKILSDQFIENEVDLYIRKFIEIRDFKFYICSLSLVSDKLSQWLAYANNGRGISIGFDAPLVNQLIGNDVSIRLRDVLYEDADQDEILNLYLECMAVRNHVTDYDLKDYSQALASVAACCKNLSFKDEHEWRIIYSADIQRYLGFGNPDRISPIKFRSSHNRIIPYYEFDISVASGVQGQENLPCGAIKEIWLGPKCEIDEADLRLLLEHNGLSNVEIKRSAATYR